MIAGQFQTFRILKASCWVATLFALACGALGLAQRSEWEWQRLSSTVVSARKRQSTISRCEQISRYSPELQGRHTSAQTRIVREIGLSEDLEAW